jgi:hypothetical protein
MSRRYHLVLSDTDRAKLEHWLKNPPKPYLRERARSILLMGAGVLTTALVRLGRTIGAGQAFAFIGMLLAGGVIVYSFWLILASLSF